jgi:hypothetical protein
VPLVPHSDELRRLASAPGNDHPRLSTGAALPTSAPTSDAPCRRSSTGAEAPASASATACGVWTQTNPTAQDARKPTRIRGEPPETPGAPGTHSWRRFNTVTDASTFAVKRRPTHLAPFSHPAPPRRASTRLGSAEHYAGSTSREARTGIRMHRTGNLQTRLSKMSTRFRLDCCSLETAAGSALHGARPTSATDPEARSGVVFRTEPRRFGYL